MNRVAVTGATGFVGRHLCRWLHERGVDALQVSRALMAGPELAAALSGVDAVVHLAGRAHQLRDDSADPAAAFHAANVVLTEKVAKACAAAGVRRLVFASSAGVLGNSSPPSGFEDGSPAAPHDDYTRSKLAAEEWLLAESTASTEIVILRPPLVYGPGAPGNFHRMMHAVLAGWPLPLGRLRAPRSMISVRNLCDALTQAATTSLASGCRMLVADLETTSIAELARMIATAAGRPARIIDVPEGLLAAGLKAAGRGADLARLLQPFVLHGSVAAQELRWQPPHALAAEIEWTVRAMDRPAS